MIKNKKRPLNFQHRKNQTDNDIAIEFGSEPLGVLDNNNLFQI